MGWGIAGPREPQAYQGRQALPVRLAGRLRSSSLGVCDSRGGWLEVGAQVGGKGVCVGGEAGSGVEDLSLWCSAAGAPGGPGTGPSGRRRQY